VATANDVSALPPEFVRKGRFDEVFFVDLPGADARRDIFKLHLTRRRQDTTSFDLRALADLAAGFSGAEIEQAIISGLFEAFATNARLTTEVLASELRDTRPLSRTMSERLDQLRRWARDRTVPADGASAVRAVA
jgi:SpoVK/Ycf46/Vps4 family AAA+-type ATPase